MRVKSSILVALLMVVLATGEAEQGEASISQQEHWQGQQMYLQMVV